MLLIYTAVTRCGYWNTCQTEFRAQEMSGKWAGSEPMRADLLMVVWIVFPVVCVCVGNLVSSSQIPPRFIRNLPQSLATFNNCVCVHVCVRALCR